MSVSHSKTNSNGDSVATYEDDSHYEDKLHDIEIGSATTRGPKRTKPFIVLVALCAALGGLIFGYDIAGAGGTFVMDGFKEHFGWTCPVDEPLNVTGCTNATQSEIDRDQGLINGLFGVGATIGAGLGPGLADGYGRRMCLYVASGVFIFGAAMQAGAPDMNVMWAGRVFSGLGIGALSMSVPVYIAELAPEHARGKLATLWQLAITVGILIASAANLGLREWDDGWRISYGGNIIFALFLIVALFFMPESPRWLAAHTDADIESHDSSLRRAMKKIRFDDEIDDELHELVEECQEEKELGVASWRELFNVNNKMRYRLLLGIGLQGFQQISGINSIMFYAPSILNEFFGEQEAIIGTFALNFVNFFATFIAIYCIERVGRVKLLFSGGIIMMLALVAEAILASVEATPAVGYIVTVFAAIFIIGFAYSWGPVVWVVCAEFFPLRARGKATGMTTMTNWIFTTIVGAVFPVAKTASLTGCFAFFSVMITLGTVMVYFYLAETANKNIIEIDEVYAKHKPKLLRKKW